MKNEKIVQTAGRDQLGDFAPNFARFNDDILFGEQWNDENLSVKTKCIVTVTSLIASGMVDSSLEFHLINAKNNGVTKEEIAAIIAHVGFYAGWPKAWAAFRLAKKVWEENGESLTEKKKFQREIIFPIGEKNDAYAKYFKGQSYLTLLSPICATSRLSRLVATIGIFITQKRAADNCSYVSAARDITKNTVRLLSR